MFSKAYISEYSRNIRIALPIMLGQAGHMITQIADAIMVGQLGSTELAAASLANSIFILFIVIVFGISTGITTLVGLRHGNRDVQGIRDVVTNSFWSTLAASIVLVLIALLSDGLLELLGQPEEVVALARPYFRILSLSLIPLLMFSSIKQFIDGLEDTLPGMSISLLGNVLNVILNYVLIYIVFDWFGNEETRYLGAAYATVIARAAMAVGILLLALFHKRYRQYTSDLFSIRLRMDIILSVFKLGIPIGLQYLLEAGAFIFGAIMVGWIDEVSIAAHQIALTVVAFTYMFASGLSATATIRLSNLAGSGALNRLKLVSGSIFILVIGLELFFSIAVFLLNEQIAWLYIDEKPVVDIAATLLITSALFQLFDGIQVTSMSALRGLADVRIPTAIALVSYWVVSLPIGYYFMEYRGFGANGIWIGFLAGLGIASILLTGRFIRVLDKTVSGKITVRT